jgi:hypothetical protein
VLRPSRVTRRAPYYAYPVFFAPAINRLVGVRQHWAKYFPLAVVEIAGLYPELERFREVAPNGVFRKDYTRRVLGL